MSRKSAGTSARKSARPARQVSARRSVETAARRSTPKSDGFTEFVLDQLAALNGLRCVPMFGGYGLYQDATFFGIIHRGRLFFKTDERTRAAYVARGMRPFRPNSKQTLKNYYEVPVEVIEDKELLVAWALHASSQQ